MLPAVVTVPPPRLPPPSCRHFSVCVTGSQAIKAARCPLSGALPTAAGVGMRLGAGAPGAPRPNTMPKFCWPGVYLKAGSMAKLKLLVTLAGRYTRPVAGLYDIGAQL